MSIEISPKKSALELLERADEDITFDEIMYELHILQKMERGLNDIKNKRSTSHSQVKEEFKKWLT